MTFSFVYGLWPFASLKSQMLGSEQTYKRVKQKCLHFYFRATGLVLVQWSHKWSRFARLTHLSSLAFRLSSIVYRLSSNH